MMERELTVEQEFQIRAFETKVKNLNLKHSKQLLVELYKHSVLKEEMYKRLIKQEWGIG